MAVTWMVTATTAADTVVVATTMSILAVDEASNIVWLLCAFHFLVNCGDCNSKTHDLQTRTYDVSIMSSVVKNI